MTVFDRIYNAALLPQIKTGSADDAALAAKALLSGGVDAMELICRSDDEAAAIDGASPWRRFRTIIFPLLSPTSFFLLVVNTIYTLFETFGIVHAVTQGGPSKATETLIYKVFNDGFIGLDFGGSSAQSVVLMLIVMVLTFLQFRYVERKVTY